MTENRPLTADTATPADQPPNPATHASGHERPATPGWSRVAPEVVAELRAAAVAEAKEATVPKPAGRPKKSSTWKPASPEWHQQIRSSMAEGAEARRQTELEMEAKAAAKAERAASKVAKARAKEAVAASRAARKGNGHLPQPKVRRWVSSLG